MIKRIITLIILAWSLDLYAGQSELEISECAATEISPSVFSIKYFIKNTFNSESASKYLLTLPLEKYILQGPVENNLLMEKDFLFSQIDIDLNGNLNMLDSFRVKIANNKLSIERQSISPLIKTTANFTAMIPFNQKGDNNINRVTETGKPFTLRKITPDPIEITLGLSPGEDIEFRKFPNSLLIIEVVTADKITEGKLSIDGQNPFIGYTNEKDLTSGEKSYRYVSFKNVPIKNITAGGEIILKGISRPFALRLTYYFTISDNLILLNQKIIRVN